MTEDGVRGTGSTTSSSQLYHGIPAHRVGQLLSSGLQAHSAPSLTGLDLHRMINITPNSP